VNLGNVISNCELFLKFYYQATTTLMLHRTLGKLHLPAHPGGSRIGPPVTAVGIFQRSCTMPNIQPLYPFEHIAPKIYDNALTASCSIRTNQGFSSRALDFKIERDGEAFTITFMHRATGDIYVMFFDTAGRLTHVNHGQSPPCLPSPGTS
jgi:hypothetical protein